MKTFVSSTGIMVEQFSDSLNLESSGDRSAWIEPWAVKALREFFQHSGEKSVTDLKPWHEAKPGEVWVLTDYMGQEHAMNLNDRGDFQFLDGHATYPIDSPAFSAGRLIWPESD